MGSQAAPVGANASFTLIARDACLRSLRKTNPMAPVVRGDVARIDGKLFARWIIPGTVGGAAFGYAEIDKDADLDHRPGVNVQQITPDGRIGYGPIPHDHNLINNGVIVDPFNEIAGTVEKSHSQWAAVDVTTQADREVKAFCAQWPTVAAMLGLGSSEAFRLFNPGRVRRTMKIPVGLDINWPELLGLHVIGEFGLWGRFSETPLAAGPLFTLGLQHMTLQSNHAIQAGYGVIRSRYALDDAQQAKIPPWDGLARRGAVEIVTALDRGRAETLMTLAMEVDGNGTTTAKRGFAAH
jgi:hypothetical protein